MFIQFCGWSVEIQKHWSTKLQSQGQLFPYHWITKAPTVICFALQRPLSNLLALLWILKLLHLIKYRPNWKSLGIMIIVDISPRIYKKKNQQGVWALKWVFLQECVRNCYICSPLVHTWAYHMEEISRRPCYEYRNWYYLWEELRGWEGYVSYGLSVLGVLCTNVLSC